MFFSVIRRSGIKFSPVPLPIEKVILGTKPALQFPTTPQDHMLLAEILLANGFGGASSGQIWLSSSLQLKVLLRTHSVDVGSYFLKNAVVKLYLANCTTDKEFKSNWDAAYLAHVNSYKNTELDLSEIEDWMVKSTNFCNTLYDIQMQGRFNKQELRNTLAKVGLDKQLIDISPDILE